MKVLFIHTGSENLGLEVLSACLKQHGHETALLFDPATFSGQDSAKLGILSRFMDITDRLVDAAIDSDANLIGFSTFTINYQWALDIAARIKKRTGKPIIFGGVHATAVPHRVLRNPQVDAVVVGEGEGAMLDLLNGMSNGRLPDKPIPNVWRRIGNDIVGEPPRPYIRDMDSLPLPDKDLFYDKVPVFARSYMIMTSRGCPYHCSYCSNSLYHKLYSSERGQVRRRSSDNVIEELRWACERYRPSFISFWDDVFTSDRKWFRRFGELYSAIGLQYDCYTHPLVIDEERAQVLADTGCFRVKIGMQTVSEHTRLTYLDRPGTVEQTAKAIRILKSHGITVGIDHMLGLPGEGTAEQDAAAEFYSETMPDRINSYWMLYFPGTKMVEQSRSNGTLTERDVDDIEEGKGETSYMYISNKSQTARAALAPYQTFYDLLPMLPQWLAKWMVRHGWSRKIPYNPLIRQILVTIAAIFQRDRRYSNTIITIFSLKRVP